MKKVIALVLSLIMVCSLAGCSGKEVAQDSAVNEVTVTSLEWECLDPYQATEMQDMQEFVATPLFLRESDGTLSPNIAESYELNEDGTVITITLPEDLKFYDGTPLTANDVKRSIEWGMEISPYNTDYAAIKSIETDGNKVIINLTEFSTTVLYYLGDQFMAVVKAEQIDTLSEDELYWGAITYGPYYVEEHVAGSHVTLKKNEYYKTLNPHVENKGAFNVDKVTVRFITDEFAMVQGLVAGEIDYVMNFPSTGLAEIEKNKDLKAKSTTIPSVFRFLLNNDNEIFADKKVCEAIMLLIDREAIAEYSGGTVSPAYAYVVDGMNDQNEEVAAYFEDTYCNNKEKALKLLKEAGWTDSDGDGYLDKNGKKFEFTFSYKMNHVTKTMSEVIQIQMKEAGIMMNIQEVDAATRNMMVETDDNYDACAMGFYWGDTSSTLPYIVEDDNVFADNSYFELCNDTAQEIDDAKRAAAFGDAQKMLMDTCRNFPVLKANTLIVYNQNKLKDAYIDGRAKLYLNDVK